MFILVHFIICPFYGFFQSFCCLAKGSADCKTAVNSAVTSDKFPFSSPRMVLTSSCTFSSVQSLISITNSSPPIRNPLACSVRYLPDKFRCFQDHSIAFFMSEGIIHAFQIVNVEINYTDGTVILQFFLTVLCSVSCCRAASCCHDCCSNRQ